MIDAQELAHAVKAWRGHVPAREAAKALGLPHRTLEHIEAGRGFRYPELLKNALARFPAPKEPSK